MKLYSLRILLLSTFVFWATGLAKYTHEALEHHGRDASIDDDDDDDSPPAATVAGASAVPQDQSQIPPKPKHPCPVCQMLAAMVVDRSVPPVFPQLSLRLIGTLAVADHVAPIIHAHFSLPARGPPRSLASI